MHIIDVTVRDKVAMARGDQYVCGNTDYIARFDFDSEWDEYETKTARFVMQGGKYIDVVFTGTDCPVPKMVNISYFNIGAFAGDLHTTTPAMVKSQKSILCGSGSPKEPAPDVYAQIMELLNKGGGGSGGMGGSDWNAKESEPGHVLNRTHYEETTTVSGDTLTWDGNTEGLVSVDAYGMLVYHVSDAVPTIDDFANGCTFVLDGESYEYPSDYVYTVNGLVVLEDMAITIVPSDNYASDITFPKAGIYFMADGESYISSLTIPGYTGFTRTDTVVHKLDPKYIKDMYYHAEKEITVLDVTLDNPVSDDHSNVFQTNNILLEDRKIYTVVFNGETFQAQAKQFNDENLYHMGNPWEWLGENLIQYPFGVRAENGITKVADYNQGETCSIKISYTETTLKQLETKYLPDGVPYCIDGGMVEVLPECQPVFNEDMGMFIIESGVPDLEIGVEYTVNWNGTEYTCECLDSAVARDPGGFCLGDIYTVSGGQVGTAPTGEPFVMMGAPGLGMMIMPIYGAAELTLSIYKNNVKTRKLDNRCLDLEWVPSVIKKEIMAERTISFLDSYVMVDDLGSEKVSLGQVLKVYFNGKVYTETVYGAGYDGWMIGNPETGSPFIFILNKSFSYFGSTQQGEHTVAIYDENEVNKIPEKYMPESLEGVILRSSTADSTKLFKLTVDDSGNITATEVT